MVSHHHEAAALSVYFASRHIALVMQGQYRGDFLLCSLSSHLFFIYILCPLRKDTVSLEQKGAATSVLLC